MREEVLSVISQLEQNVATLENRKSKRIGLFGAGRYGSIVLSFLRKQGFNIVCYIDNSQEKQNTIKDELKIVSADDPLVKSLDYVISAIRGGCSNPGALDFDAYYVVKNFKEYEKIRNNEFHDDKSKETLDAILLSTLTGSNTYFQSVMDFNQYFCLPQFINTFHDYFVDVGAYVGDGVERFIWANTGIFKQIHAFEPTTRSFTALEKRVARLSEEWALSDDSITLYQAGVADKDYLAAIGDSGVSAGSCISEQESSHLEQRVQVHSLDHKLQGVPVTFLKADIEGMEMPMLRGARQLILKNKPKLAICVYHNIFDLIEILQYILELVPEYKMALRHHSPSFAETVLYFWVE